MTIFTPDESHQILRESIADFAQEEVAPGALERDRSEKFDLDLFKKFGDLGLLGVTAPEKFGGSGMDATSAVIVHEEISAADPGICLSYLAHAMLCVNNVARNASDAQKEKYLPKLCSGEWVGAMAMSESQAGTDVLGMKSVANKTTDGYDLTGQKMWITNGARDNSGENADVVFVYAKTNSRVSSFIVEGSDAGFSVGQIIKDKCGMRASITAELVFDNCKLPLDRLVGQEGDAILHMMRNLELERLTLAAMSLGIAKKSLEVMLNYAKERQAFGKSLSQFGQIQSFIGQSYAEYQAARSYVYQVAGRMDLEKDGKSNNSRVDSDGVKLFAAKTAKNIADRAIQTLGGNGYVGEYHVERLWRDAKLLEIGGGTNEAHEKNMTKDLIRNL